MVGLRCVSVGNYVVYFKSTTGKVRIERVLLPLAMSMHSSNSIPGSASELSTADIKAEARRLGFELCGICPAASPPGIERFEQWLAGGYAGQMHYLHDRREAYQHPARVLEGSRSVIMLAMNYRTDEPVTPQPGQGRVSRYAWGEDYHDIIRDRLSRLAEWMKERSPDATVRGVVDTAPLLEREFAQLAGLGWIGKNTLLLNKELGSWFFLAALLTNIELESDALHAVDHCGTCRACLDACPTGAFVDAYVLDARKCISYLTIELREAVPEELREGVGDWLFGCDVCQDVCPWNHRAPVSSELAFQPIESMNPVDLAGLFDLDETAFRQRFRHTPLWRAKRRGLLRNAAIVLGNRPSPSAVSALAKGLSDGEPMVRAACAWGLGKQCHSSVCNSLEARLIVELDPAVRAEIELAIAHAASQLSASEASTTGWRPGKSSA